MAGRHPRIIQLVHGSPGRTRLRLEWLRDLPDDATALADHLSTLSGMTEVAVRPWTGSVLCHYDPARLDEARIVAAVRRQTKVAVVTRPGELSVAAEAEYTRAAQVEERSVARAIADGFRALDGDVLVASEGRLDLGTLTGLGFLVAGAAEIVLTKQLPAPPWFTLAWWAFRTFTMFEHEVTHPPARPRAVPASKPHSAKAVTALRPTRRRRTRGSSR